MKLYAIVTLTVILIYMTSAYKQNSIASQQTDGIDNLCDIIRNFFVQYFSDVQMFISIIFPPTEKIEHFMDELFVNLFADPSLNEFSHSTLHRLDNTIRENRYAFNLIIIDNCQAL